MKHTEITPGTLVKIAPLLHNSDAKSIVARIRSNALVTFKPPLFCLVLTCDDDTVWVMPANRRRPYALAEQRFVNDLLVRFNTMIYDITVVSFKHTNTCVLNV